FFQAEDGIRDFHVTGVQTCALPICLRGDFEFIIIEATPEKVTLKGKKSGNVMELIPLGNDAAQVIESYQDEADFFAQFRSFKIRSEERRVGKRCKYGRR